MSSIFFAARLAKKRRRSYDLVMQEGLARAEQKEIFLDCKFVDFTVQASENGIKFYNYPIAGKFVCFFKLFIRSQITV